MIHTSRNTDKKTLLKQGTLFFVDGIQRTLPAEDIEKYFSKFGELDYFSLCRNKEGKSFGYGWLHFHFPVKDLGVEHVVRNITLRIQGAAGPQQTDILLNKIKESREISNSLQPISKQERSLTSCSTRSLSSDRAYTRRRYETPSKESSVESSDHHNFNESKTPIALSTHPEAQFSPSPASFDTSFYVCIPIALCPRIFLADPRVFLASMNSRSPGLLTALNFESQPLQTNMFDLSLYQKYYSLYDGGVNSHYYASRTLNGVQPQMYAEGYTGMQLQNPPPPGPPPNRGPISQ